MYYGRRRSADVEYFLPPIGGQLCWDSPVPCVEKELTGIALRNSGEINGGFVRINSFLQP